jgi:glutaredoxin
MSNIIVYSKENCPNCDILKQLLNKENIEYEITKIDTPKALTELRMNSVFTMSAPVLQIDDNFYTLSDMADSNVISKDRIMKIIENYI